MFAVRLSSGRYPANSGKGSALFGGRWNRKGTPVIYTASSVSLATLEILAHFSVLPTDYTLTVIEIPSQTLIETVADEDLPPGWSSPTPIKATQAIGARWIKAKRSAVLSVPSCIVRMERNLVLNPAHPDFRTIQFMPPTPHQFDPRLKNS